MSIHHLTSKDEKSKLPVFVSELHKDNDIAGFDTDLVSARLNGANNLTSLSGINFHYTIMYTNEYKITDYYGQFAATNTASQVFFSIQLNALSSEERSLYAYVHMDRPDSNDEYQGSAIILDPNYFQLGVLTNASLDAGDVIFSYHLKTIKPLSL